MADETMEAPPSDVTVMRVSYVQVIDEPRPEVSSLEAVRLKDQPPTDKGFKTPSGTSFRARIVRIAEQAALAPTSGQVELAPSSVTMSLSLALLDDDGKVASDAEDRLLIMDRHEILLSDEAMKLGLLDVQASVERILRQEAYALEARLAKRAEATSYFADAWGGARLTAAQAEQLVVAPVLGSAVPEPYVPPPSPNIVSEAADEPVPTEEPAT